MHMCTILSISNIKYNRNKANCVACFSETHDRCNSKQKETHLVVTRVSHFDVCQFEITSHHTCTYDVAFFSRRNILHFAISVHTKHRLICHYLLNVSSENVHRLSMFLRCIQYKFHQSTITYRC